MSEQKLSLGTIALDSNDFIINHLPSLIQKAIAKTYKENLTQYLMLCGWGADQIATVIQETTNDLAQVNKKVKVSGEPVMRCNAPIPGFNGTITPCPIIVQEEGLRCRIHGEHQK